MADVMLTHLRRSALLGFAFVACVAGVACTAGTGSTSGGLLQPVKEGEVTSPETGLRVTATLSSVTLGEECGSSSGGFAPSESGDCAAPPPADPDAGAPSSKSDLCGGPSVCQQSNMQIAFTASVGSKSAQIDIVRVELVDPATGKVVDTLTSSKPQAWSGSAYAAWDENLKPASQLKASYDLTAPAWSKISSNSAVGGYSTPYKVHVTLSVDGVEITLESAELSREPAVAT